MPIFRPIDLLVWALRAGIDSGRCGPREASHVNTRHCPFDKNLEKHYRKLCCTLRRSNPPFRVLFRAQNVKIEVFRRKISSFSEHRHITANRIFVECSPLFSLIFGEEINFEISPETLSLDRFVSQKPRFLTFSLIL